MNLVFLVCDQYTQFIFGAFSTKELAEEAISKLVGVDLSVIVTSLDTPLIME